MTKLTIVTCVYNLIKDNRKDFFIQNLESVHNQTYKNYEHIVIYTPCNDGTYELIKEYENKGWIKVYTFFERGIYQAMQFGISVATGDFINFLNSDDYFSDEAVFDKVTLNVNKNNADWFFSDSYMLYQNGYIENFKCDIKNAPFGWGIVHQTMFVSKKALDEMGGFDFNYDVSLDNHMILKLILKKYKYAYLDEPTVVFRKGGFSSDFKWKNLKYDYAINFYDQIGKKWGLTVKECEILYSYGRKSHVSLRKLQHIAEKLQIEEWSKTYIKESIKFYKKRDFRRKFKILFNILNL